MIYFYFDVHLTRNTLKVIQLSEDSGTNLINISQIHIMLEVYLHQTQYQIVIASNIAYKCEV
jgi:hypothetical protein